MGLYACVLFEMSKRDMNEELNQKGTHRILVEVDLSKEPNKTRVLTPYSAWDTSALLLEAVGVMVQQAIQGEKIPQQEAYKKTCEYFMKILSDYDVTFKQNSNEEEV